LQAERELGANLEQLSQYAIGVDSPAAARYLPPLLAASQHLGKLSLARDKLVSSGRAELADDVEREVSNIRGQADLLEQLPLLGVKANAGSNTDDFSALMGLENSEKTETQDTGVDLKRELNSLLTRYPAELKRTREQIQRRADLAAGTHLKIAGVQQAIAGLEPVVLVHDWTRRCRCAWSLAVAQDGRSLPMPGGVTQVWRSRATWCSCRGPPSPEYLSARPAQ